MRQRAFTSFLFLLSFIFVVPAQNKEAIKFDEFGRLPCGDFMARMDGLLNEWQDSPDSKIYVVYYGGRFIKEPSGWNQETRSYNKIKLKYSHREDGINWAKSIPLYLTTYENYPATVRNLLKDNIVLIDGGFRENTELEVWLVPKGAESPKPTPTIAEKDINFRKDKPFRTPNFALCYSGLDI